jgi:hypothetical protein
MVYKQVEKIIGGRPFYINHIDWYATLIVDLYESSIGNRNVSSLWLDFDKKMFEELYLPERLAFYYSVREEGIRHITGENISRSPDFGRNCIKAADYFWKNFIAVSKKH